MFWSLLSLQGQQLSENKCIPHFLLIKNRKINVDDGTESSERSSLFTEVSFHFHGFYCEKKFHFSFSD